MAFADLILEKEDFKFSAGHFTIFDANERENLLAAIEQAWQAREAGHRLYTFVHGHSIVQDQVVYPSSPGYLTQLNKNWFEQHDRITLQPGDFVFCLGYDHRFQGNHYGNWHEDAHASGATLVWSLATYRDEHIGPIREAGELLIDQQWAYGDAVVPVPGTPVTIAPTSGHLAQMILRMFEAGLMGREREGSLRGRRIVALVAEGFHPGETRQPMAYWEALGAEVIAAGIATGVVSAAFGPQQVEITHVVEDIDVASIDAIFVPGGQSPAVLRESEAVLEFVRAAKTSGAVVTAICHGPQVLIAAGVVDGLRATCVVVEERDYFDVRDALEAAGAIYVNEPVVIDGALVTSRLPQDVDIFKGAVAEVLARGRAEAVE